MPFIHLYRTGESNEEGLHEEYSRVTVFAQGDRRFGEGRPSIVLGTLPDVSVVLLSEVRWFWIEAD